MREDADLAEDLLWGAGPIAKAVFGRADKKHKRKVYHLHEQKRIPTWRHRDPDGNEKGPIISRRSLIEKAFAGPGSDENSPSF